MNAADPTDGGCPVPGRERSRVLLGHGSGGRLSAELIGEVLLPALGAAAGDGPLEDAAVVTSAGPALALSTDAYVVSPLFFAGGDIGCLAVHGTVNDLAMRAAMPLALCLAYVIEEGFPIEDLRRVAASAGAAARDAGVPVVTGDTKVVGRGPRTGSSWSPPASAGGWTAPRRRRRGPHPATPCCCRERSATTASPCSAPARASASRRICGPTPGRCTGWSRRW
ncbi:hypothetical protein Asp14428_07850 [Actinoplanes sp. NBRC 14428]|nr:hypothetical protein Asp14428_07850 [Actinoplanes sp. NBRC 14428]